MRTTFRSDGRIAAAWLLVIGALVPGAVADAQEAPAGARAEAESARVHTVRRGDTLWDLAARFLADPLRWPAIYQLNPSVVEDPHWIYPGEELRIPGAGVARVDRVRVERADDYLGNVGRAQEGEPGRYPAGSIFRQPRDAGSGLSTLALDARPPLPAVSPDDFRRAPLLVRPGELGAQGATARVMEENPLRLGLPTGARQHVDVVLALGGLQPAVGDSLKAVRYVRTEGVHGQVVVPKALLQVRRVWGDSARADVVQVYGDYQIGDAVVGLAPYELDPAASYEDVEDGPGGSVVAFEVPQVLIGPGEHVFLDIGIEAGVRLGDEFGVFSREERDAIERGPRDALAVVRVVHVTPSTSTARVVHVRDPGARAGDPVLLLRRLAETLSEPAG